MISIIVPTYNAEQYLEKCLNSLVGQTEKNIEIVCINDGSTDNSLTILNEYAARDPRIKVLSFPNAGPGASRNKGIEASHGDYLMFVDADDELDREAVSLLYRRIREDNSQVAAGTISVTYEAHEELKESDSYYYTIKCDGCNEITDEIIDSFHSSPCGVMFSRRVIEEAELKFPEGLKYEDAYWHWCYLTQCKRISFVSVPVYKYYRHPISIMSQTFESSKSFSIQHVYIADRIFDFWEKQNQLECRLEMAQKILEAYFWFAIRYAPNVDKSLIAYKTHEIIEKYGFDVEKNPTLKKLKMGSLAFLYPEGGEQQNSPGYAKYLQIKSKIDKLLPKGTTRRRIAYNLARMCYKAIA